MTYIEQVNQQVLRVFSELWPSVLIGDYQGSPSVEIKVVNGKLTYIHKRLTAGKMAIPDEDRMQKAQALVADQLEIVLPQVLAGGFFGSATLSLNVVSGYPASCTCNIEEAIKPLLAS